MLFFRSEEHVIRWCKNWKFKTGGIISLDQGWLLAQAWYGPDRRKPEWRRKTFEETEVLFAQLGLSGTYWNLRG